MNNNTNKPSSTKYEVYTEVIDQYIAEDTFVQSDIELITSPGFIHLMSLFLVPCIIFILIMAKLAKRK